MIRIIDTFSKINSLFENGVFDFEKWKRYMESVYNGCTHIFIDDLHECLRAGNYTYEKDVLPIILDVYEHPEAETLHTSFCRVTNDLHQRVCDCFGRELDIDIVLYLGLCNAAGWVTNINGREVILLGVEKILELKWHDENAMRGLIYHELGHMYHKQYGIFDQSRDKAERNFVWQLFTEGIAMYFEQALVRDFSYYHQDMNGWLEWCDDHLQQITADFHHDLHTMTHTNQRYFGDWVSYNGKGDVGYYLGTKFVHWLSAQYDFEELINMKIDDVYQAYLLFTESIL